MAAYMQRDYRPSECLEEDYELESWNFYVRHIRPHTELAFGSYNADDDEIGDFYETAMELSVLTGDSRGTRADLSRASSRATVKQPRRLESRSYSINARSAMRYELRRQGISLLEVLRRRPTIVWLALTQAEQMRSRFSNERNKTSTTIETTPGEPDERDERLARLETHCQALSATIAQLAQTLEATTQLVERLRSQVDLPEYDVLFDVTGQPPVSSSSSTMTQ